MISNKQVTYGQTRNGVSMRQISSAAGIDFPSTAVAIMTWAVVAVIIVSGPVYSYLSF